MNDDNRYWWLISALSRWTSIRGAEIKLTTDHQAFILYGTEDEVRNEAIKIMHKGHKQNPPDHTSIKLMAVMSNPRMDGTVPFDGPSYHSIYIAGNEDAKTY